MIFGTDIFSVNVRQAHNEFVLIWNFDKMSHILNFKYLLFLLITIICI